MIPDLKHAHHLGNYMIRLTFADGRTGDIDLANELWGEVFEPLRDPDVFKQFRVDEELGTLCWPNGADFAPEFLYEAIATSTPQRESTSRK